MGIGTESACGNDLFSLSNKTILITGGTRGIGRAISLRFARAGATVIANYLRNEQAAEHLKAIATEERLAIMLCRADLTNERGLEQLDHLLQDCVPHLSGLVHCAATGIHRPIEELTERHFDWTFNLNVRAFFKSWNWNPADASKPLRMSRETRFSSWDTSLILP